MINLPVIIHYRKYMPNKLMDKDIRISLLIIALQDRFQTILMIKT